MESLLDFSVPTNVPLLDEVVAAFYLPTHPHREDAARIVSEFERHPESWTRVDVILAESGDMRTKYLALKVLENVINFRWKALPRDQREGIRTYVVQKIIKLSSDEEVYRAERLLVGKMNVLLVAILKHDWPAQWPSFISDIVAASKTSATLCENNMDILRLLSEDVFDFSKHTMTTQRATRLKTSLKDEFSAIFGLLLFVLELDPLPKASLVNATLQCLHRYVTWIPEPYIFETPLLEKLIMRLLPREEFRVSCLQVLSEVVTLVNPDYDHVFALVYMTSMGEIVKVVPPDVNIAAAFEAAVASGDEASQLFVRRLAIFLTSFFRHHVTLLETEEYRDALLSGMSYLVGISDAPDAEVFKICVEYWLTLAEDLYKLEMRYDPRLPALSDDGTPLPTGSAAAMGGVPSMMTTAGLTAGLAGFSFGASAAGAGASPRKALYAETLVRVREIMIRHMAKPEEVLIVKDESGEYVKQEQVDTDAVALYKVMRDAMIFLTHLDPVNTQEQVLEKLAKEATSAEWSQEALNTLCWAIGSISGTMSEGDEKALLVTIIKDLLVMCEEVKGKSKKAVIASNIMYVVGQYPRFLRAHWRFLRTVVLKLFEFMHEKHPGVQDMAVDTFLKICVKCKRKFVQLQQGESQTFVEEVCTMLPTIINELEAHQVNGFYEGVGHMVSAHPDEGAREALTERLMLLPNSVWSRLMRSAAEDIACLQNVDVLRDVQRVLRINEAACRSIGATFAKQLGRLYLDMLNVYKAVAGVLASAVAASGDGIMLTQLARLMSGVKRQVMALVGTYVDKADDIAFVAANFVPHLLEPVLGDFVMSPAATREAAVLRLMTQLVTTLRGAIADDTPRILSVAFETTLPLLTAAASAAAAGGGDGAAAGAGGGSSGMMEIVSPLSGGRPALTATDLPELCIEFFKLLDAVNQFAFPAFFGIPVEQQKVVVDSVMWAVRHVNPDIGELGLAILSRLVTNFASSGAEISQPFFSAYLLPLLRDIIAVVTDRLHKAHLKQHAELLRQLVTAVEAGEVKSPLWETSAAAEFGAATAFAAGLTAGTYALNNSSFVRVYIRALIATAFPHLSEEQASAFIASIFDLSADAKAYKTGVRDFLIATLEFKEEEAVGGDLFAEERAAAMEAEKARRAAIPGMANPYDVPDKEGADDEADDL